MTAMVRVQYTLRGTTYDRLMDANTARIAVPALQKAYPSLKITTTEVPR